jgi:RNA polymerase sigma-70 factor (ECF subfamily)
MLIGLLRDFQAAEDVLHEVTADALSHWQARGVPERPGAWLSAVARNRALDRLRGGRIRRDKVPQLQHLAHLTHEEREARDVDELDERLRLVFTCCHPALAVPAQVALTLRTLCGLRTPEIARAFLVPEPTMAQRLVRAKKKIQAAGIPYRVPGREQLDERLEAVLSVVLLVFNEGYHASSGAELVRRELTVEALRLARLLRALMPEEDEVRGLLALMLFQDSRRATRLDAEGVICTLEAQDRGLWDRAAIGEAMALTGEAVARGGRGVFVLQAALASEHARAERFEHTRWGRLVQLYDVLLQVQPSAVVRLNRAAALGFAEGPEAGLAAMEDLDPELPGYSLLPAARADLLRRAGRLDEAREHYLVARSLAGSEPEKRFYEARLAGL